MIGASTKHSWIGQAQPRAIGRFFRSPKGLVLLVIAVLTVVAAPAEGVARVGPFVGAAVASAVVTDLALARWLRGRWIFPSGAILTGLIVALVLSPAEGLEVPLGTAAIAIASKYLLRNRWANIFNPAALALIVAYFAFGTGESWWGALPDLPTPSLILVVALGLFIADRVNKLPMVLAFLGTYVALFTASAFLGDPARVAEIFRVPDVNSVLFFAFLMLDDPPTSPVRYGDQVWYGVIVSAASYAIFFSTGAVYYLLAGLLVGNVWEALRRDADHPAAKPATS